jgi:GGDEF domain-containing protein
VLFIDLVGSRQINDDSGHRVGDATLLAVVARLRGVVRDQDLLGRLAGDEFVVGGSPVRPPPTTARATTTACPLGSLRRHGPRGR